MPFTAAEFLDVFRDYNTSVWPAQIALIALAVACGVLLIRARAHDSRSIATVLGLLWCWMAVAYHFMFFASINRAAILFGFVFLCEAFLLFWYGVRAERLRFAVTHDVYGVIGSVMIVFALVGYPVLGFALGRRYPASPTFGLPCPTTIFTLGFLLLARAPVPRRLLVIPILWSLLGAMAATRLGVAEDYSLLVAGLVTIGLVLWRDRSMPRTRQPATSSAAAAPRAVASRGR